MWGVPLLRRQNGGVQRVTVRTFELYANESAGVSVVVVGYHALDEQLATATKSVPEINDHSIFWNLLLCLGDWDSYDQWHHQRDQHNQ